ncbi:RloB domain-containing protein [Pedobacter changchengzhani]|uniref:RloB domain-containing protein n=1 Tax=Pedobacter changchengzhani TaxID=2529274 RepID=A0A4R5MNF7_9SPHI|nr:RloB family protein [Pedobacter changchengzhani]TDG37096.1 RloB domain-containing protein [Pedobacter changchengzhani]
MKRTNSKQIPIGKKGLILCEGETETNYFQGLTTQDKYKRKFAGVGVEVYKPKNHSPVGLVTEAKRRIREAKSTKSPFNFVWIVFDKDGHQNIPKAFSDAKDVKNPPIHVAFSVTCFEYFILMHFTKTTKAFEKCDDVIFELKKYFSNYEKSRNLFNDLKEMHNVACENSEWLCERCEDDIQNGKRVYELSSYTNVHKLIDALNQL